MAGEGDRHIAWIPYEVAGGKRYGRRKQRIALTSAGPGIVHLAQERAVGRSRLCFVEARPKRVGLGFGQVRRWDA